MSAASSALYDRALALGFDEQFLAQLVNKYGLDILALLVKAARGYSLEWVAEAAEKLGPVVLQIAVSYLEKHGDTPPADAETHQANVFDVIKSVVGT